VDPPTILTGDDALGPENDAVLLLVTQSAQASGDLLLGEGLGSLQAPGGEDLIGVMVVVMFVVVVVMVLMLMVMVVMVLMLMLMLVVVMVLMLMLMVVVMMVFVFMLMVMIVMMVAVAVRVVALLSTVGLQSLQRSLQGVLLLHGLHDLLTGQLLPGSGDNDGLGVRLP
jgi:hypothetical protein